MKKIKIEAELEVYEDFSELPQDIQQLMKDAFAARDSAYAPYSEFHVGAALLLSNGEIVKGSNQENAAYPSGLCAERTAIYYAGANFPDEKLEVMAISATGKRKPSTTPIPPCGACRQAIAEYEVKQKQPVVIYFMGASGKVFKSDSLSNLLPFIFTQEYL
ncbi:MULTISPECIES: cytidine deaminase [Leeuwenhoekiella]|jgi:cytidine deaminase|uniref:Cytidine deaminase n=1 Tax=Leeuwenhoekiella blandensis (strain CECT 7118 / CCUG 51940 / KCTC 22103 / MED217) TaxID=398720 RepID=A3XR06_LEEBM|nr:MULTISPECIES: cytidine deaminase [Leeuwenhoekiella]EAQ48084.1 cytidine deaminase [Leeuwenhoekiella blandensis MED217]MAO43749.1 cytidine deaminase [Leeuwenhoekiella sp.]HBT10553.1 cytidine deaminase [Leeuwenhoekiella sp.]|tara:strand:- start:646 stop:1128 length:483 start_codon:yes stop_codon:yes gene_type:complete